MVRVAEGAEGEVDEALETAKRVDVELPGLERGDDRA
jgi:hypothetical protein